jgi:hypothetical protein
LTAFSFSVTLHVSGLSVRDYTFQNLETLEHGYMTVTEQSRPTAFDIANYFAPEVVNPQKSQKRVLIFSDSFPDSTVESEIEYRLSKHLDHPVHTHYAIPSIKKELPRGIPWHNFPVLSDPFYRIGPSTSSAQWAWNPGESVVSTNRFLLARAEAVAFKPVGDVKEIAEQAYKLAHLLEKFESEAEAIAVYRDDDTIDPVSLQALRQPMQDEMRFRYSYEVNWLAIAMKAFRHLGLDKTHPYNRFQVSRTGFRFMAPLMRIYEAANLTDPLALQWLFKLRRIGSFDIAYAYETLKEEARLEAEHGPFDVLNHDETGKITLPRCENATLIRTENFGHCLLVSKDLVRDDQFADYCERLTKDAKIRWREIALPSRAIHELNGRFQGNSERFFALDGSDQGLWTGTGKHRPYSFSEKLAAAARYFVDVGLVKFEEESETVSLSETGHRLLDLLHPDCEDPDVILRWTGEDGFFKPDIGKSCDDWIMRFFSKMKTRINEIE